MQDIAVLVAHHIHVVKFRSAFLLHLSLEEELQLVVCVEQIRIDISVGKCQ